MKETHVSFSFSLSSLYSDISSVWPLTSTREACKSWASLLLVLSSGASRCQTGIFDFSLSNSTSPVESVRTGGMGTKGELWEVAVGGSDVASSSLPGNSEGDVTGNVVRGLSHGGDEIRTSGEAGFR